MITQVLEPVLLSHLYHSCAPKSVTKAFWLFICTAHKAFPNEILLSMKDPTLPPPKTTALSLVSVAVGPFLECLGKERSSQRGRGIYLCISPWQLAGEQNKTRSIQIYFPVQIFIFICMYHYITNGKDYWKIFGSLNIFAVACKHAVYS